MDEWVSEARISELSWDHSCRGDGLKRRNEFLKGVSLGESPAKDNIMGDKSWGPKKQAKHEKKNT